MAKIRVYDDEADGEEFPRLCVRCGADAEDDVANTFAWVPSWTGILIFVGLAPWLIVTLIMRKSMRITLPVCDRHRGHWRNRRLYVWLGLPVWMAYGIGLVVAFQHLPADVVNIGLGVLIFGGLLGLFVGVIYTQSGIRAREIADHWTELVRVDPQFADEWAALKPPPKPRRRPRRHPDDDDDDDGF
jgi:hypothetical protein